MDTTENIVFTLCALSCLAALLWMLRDIRHREFDPALSALAAAFGCKVVSLTLAAPSISAAVERWIGIPNLSALAVHIFGGLASSAAILIAIGYWLNPPQRARRQARMWLTLAAVSSASLVALWLLASRTASARPGNYLLDNMHQPVVTVYLLIYIGGFAAGLLETLRLCLRYSAAVTSPWLRRGLRITGLGSGIYLLYCAHRLLGVIRIHLDARTPDLEFLTPLCIGVGIPLMAIGLTIPSWGPSLSGMHSWLHSYRDYRTLSSLWRDLYRATPGIALDPPSPWRDWLPGRDVHYHLYRRLIEVHDGRLALRPFMDPAVTANAVWEARAAGLTGTAFSAAVEATCLNAALLAKKRGLPVPRETGPDDSPARENDDFAAEVRWLTEVARRRTRPPGHHRDRAAA